MIAKELIDPAVRPLTLSDRLEKLFKGAGVSSLPVVNAEGRYEGLVHRQNLPFGTGPDTPINAIRSYLLPYSVPPSAHPFEAVKLWVEYPLELFPVVSESGQYLGTISLRTLRKFLMALGPFEGDTRTFEVVVPARPYAMRDVVQALEGNGIEVRFVGPLAAPADEKRFLVSVPGHQYYEALAALYRRGWRVDQYDITDTEADDELRSRIGYFQRLLEI